MSSCLNGSIVWLASLVAMLGIASQTHAAGSDKPDRPAPLIWERGDHRVHLSLESRARAESWDAHSTRTDWFFALRSRAAAHYSWKDKVEFFGQFQDARINRLGTRASGAGALYRTHANGSGHTSGDRMRQLWLLVKPTEQLNVKAGRQDLKLGTEVMYPEGNWKYLKIARGSQRLVGTVGWSHAERSNDGFSASLDLGEHLLFAFGARPTTGVFDLDDSYSSQDDITYGGVTWTAKRGAIAKDTELRLFYIGYEDERGATDGAGGAVGFTAGRDIEVHTIGFSKIGIHRLGDGNLDVLLWGAYQWGDWYTLSHSGWAGLFELGYQFTECGMKPWLRGGINYASGDGSATDSDHETFFNILPTNHLYYGYADRYSLQNIINYFAQVRLFPVEKGSLDAFLHHFVLADDSDVRYFGTGAFNRAAFGYGMTASRGHRSLGTEIDLVAKYEIHPLVSFEAGYAYMWGHAVFNNLGDDDVRFGYLQVTAKY